MEDNVVEVGGVRIGEVALGPASRGNVLVEGVDVDRLATQVLAHVLQDELDNWAPGQKKLLFTLTVLYLRLEDEFIVGRGDRLWPEHVGVHDLATGEDKQQRVCVLELAERAKAASTVERVEHALQRPFAYYIKTKNKPRLTYLAMR